MSAAGEGFTARHALVVGYGLTGRAAAAFFARRGVSFSVSEARALSPEDDAWLAAHAEAVEQGGHSERMLTGVDGVVVSPGVPAETPLLVTAARRGIPIWSELDLAAASAGDRRLVAVTGTNGKSTTVSVIGALLTGAGVRNVVAGNIGIPFLDTIDRPEPWDVAVLEVSSFQLEQSRRFHPQVGALLNLTPNHLERHGSMAAYTAAKLRLFAHQTPSDVAILPADLASSLDHGRGRLVVYDRPLPDLPRGSDGVGEVRRLNLAAAVAVCGAVIPGFDATTRHVDELRAALYLPHRQQPIGDVRGVRLINDSKATSPAATVAAVRSTPGPVVVLLGGRSKGGGYDVLATFLSRATVRGVIVFGEARDELAGHLARASVAHAVVADLASAVAAGLDLARPGDALLLSPACSSFDAFRSFEDRGAAFERIARALAGFSPPVADS